MRRADEVSSGPVLDAVVVKATGRPPPPIIAGASVDTVSSGMPVSARAAGARAAPVRVRSRPAAEATADERRLRTTVFKVPPVMCGRRGRVPRPADDGWIGPSSHTVGQAAPAPGCDAACHGSVTAQAAFRSLPQPVEAHGRIRGEADP